MELNKQNQNFSIVNLNSQEDIPIIREDLKTRLQFVPFGINLPDDYFEHIALAFKSSTTLSACIEGISDLIFGKGMYSKNEGTADKISEILDQDDLKRVIFDLKLFGNAAFQAIWNEEHTELLSLYHIPVQTLRAAKILFNSHIEEYFYCTDWTDHKAVKNKQKFSAFGESDNQIEILYIKGYTPGLYYYSLPDWIPSLQFAMVEAELGNAHLNNIENGFLPMVMVNFNNGVPHPEERQTIENMVMAKFTGTRNAGRFMLSFNEDPTNKPTIDAIQIDNLHDKFKYVAEYAQDKILVANRITSPLIFGIRTQVKGFSSNADELAAAYSILESLVIVPFQNTILSAIDKALTAGGLENSQLYFEQLTPLLILSSTAKDTGQTIDQVQKDVDDSLENPETADDETETESNVDEDKTPIQTSKAKFKREFHIYKTK
jgi:hypothetical protein